MLTPVISILLLYMFWLTRKLKYHFRLWKLASETIKIKTCNIEAHWTIFNEKICGSEKGHAVRSSLKCLCSGRVIIFENQNSAVAQSALFKSMNLQGCSVPCWLLAEQLMWQKWAVGDQWKEQRLNKQLHSQDWGQILYFSWVSLKTRNSE